MKKTIMIALAAILINRSARRGRARPGKARASSAQDGDGPPEVCHPRRGPEPRPRLSEPLWPLPTGAPANEKLLVVSDTPENLARLLAVIKEIDVKPADIMFTVQLVLGSEAAGSPTDEALKDDKVIAELRSLLRYKTFTLLDQNFVRTLDQKGAEILMGKGQEFVITFRRPKSIKDGADDIIQAEIRLARIDIGPGHATSSGTPIPSSSTSLVQTSLTMKSGEKTVVGVSKMNGGDKGLILIISGKIIN